MEPESAPENQEIKTNENHFNKVTPLSKYLAMVLFVLMPFIGGWIGYQYAPAKIVEVERIEYANTLDVTEVPTQSTDEREDTFFSNQLNISFLIPNNWALKNVDGERPPAVKGVKHELIQSDLGCVISLGEFDFDSADYKQASFGARDIQSEITEYWGDWFVNRAYHQDEIEFSNHTRQHLKHELLEVRAGNTDVILWQKDMEPVPDQCLSDFIQHITSYKHHYLSYDYDFGQSRDGTLWVNRLRYVDKPDIYKLVFTEEGSENTYELAELPLSVNGQSITLIGNKLYYFEGDFDKSYRFSLNPRLQVFDIETGEHTKVFTHDSVAQPYVFDHVFTPSGDLYYLVNETDSYECSRASQSDCKASILKRNISEPEIVNEIVSETNGTSLIGTKGETIYVANGYGDAGCVSATYHIYNQGNLVDKIGAGGCASFFDDEPNDPGYDEYVEISSSINKNIVQRSAQALARELGEYSASAINRNERSSGFTLFQTTEE